MAFVTARLNSALDAALSGVTFTPNAAGRWDVRLEAQAPSQAAEEGVIYVRATSFSTP